MDLALISPDSLSAGLRGPLPLGRVPPSLRDSVLGGRLHFAARALSETHHWRDPAGLATSPSRPALLFLCAICATLSPLAV